jgi:hypothetical protein
MRCARLLSGVRLAIVLLAGSAASVNAQSGRLAPVGMIPGPADLVRAEGTHAYVASSKTITVFDISNPAAPKREGSYEFPEKIWGFRTAGDLLYVADGFSGLQILDVSNAAKPLLRGSLKTPGQSKNVSVSGSKAVVANHMTGIDLIDVSDTAKPVLVGSCFLDGYARDAAISGSVAYGIDNPSGLYVLDVAHVKTVTFDPANAIQQAVAPQKIELSQSARAGSVKFAVLVGGEPYDPNRTQRPAGERPRGSLQVWDLSNATAPKLATLYRTPGSPRQVALKDTLVYVADSDEGVQVLDLAAPSKPVVVATYKTSAPARDIAVAGSVVLVVLGGNLGGGSQSQTSTEIMVLRHTQ